MRDLAPSWSAPPWGSAWLCGADLPQARLGHLGQECATATAPQARRMRSPSEHRVDAWLERGELAFDVLVEVPVRVSRAAVMTWLLAGRPRSVPNCQGAFPPGLPVLLVLLAVGV